MSYTNILLSIKKMYFFLLILFVIGSFLLINPIVPIEKSDYNSSQLRKVTTEEGKSVKIDYVDENGKLTVAAELGYSTVVIFQTEQGELEYYYDDQGKPAVRRYAGYYAILREKDDNGNIIRIVYLNQNGVPVMVDGGYAEERREINKSGQTIFVRYYDDRGQKVLTELYGYGKKYEYDKEGQIKKIIYIDDDDTPMETGLGYAMVSRNYYIQEKGTVCFEFYFDKDDKPISLSLGQYGVYKEFDENGREMVITYQDVNGESANCTKGYATIKKTYHANGRTKSERYYDKQGKPYALSEGQYGIEILNNQIIYLNQYGKAMFNLRSLIYSNSFMIIPCAVSIVILSSIVNRKRNYVMLVIYIIVIAYMTLMFRDQVEIKNTSLLWGYRRILYDSEARSDIIKNIWLFIPFGAILYRLMPKKIVVLFPILISIVIEGLQYFTGTGICELDDIISNSLGGLIGIYIVKVTSAILLRIKSCRNIHTL